MAPREQLPFLIQREIVQRLARKEGLTSVAKAIKDIHGIALSLQAVQYYDPTKAAGKALSAELTAMFHAERAEFLETLPPIAHKGYQLHALQDQADKILKNPGASALMPPVIKLAAEISGTLAPTKNEHKHEGAVTPVINLYGRPGSDAAPQAVDGVRKPGD